MKARLPTVLAAAALPCVVLLAAASPQAAVALADRPQAGQEGQAAAAPVSWARDIRPLLAESCFQCHGPDEAAREADLRLDVREGYTADLGGYRAVEPGDPDASELLWRVDGAEGRDAMPPRKHADPLAPEQVELLRRWIAEGAPFEPHWAYASWREVVPPAVADETWPRNPIDRFVLARLEAHGVAPAPEADRRTLIRRLSLDLRGLPPTPSEVEAFLADDRPDAWERLVDRTLADPAFAERWARHWLDLARYADSHGFTVDGPRSMWPWRDWVVAAIDADMRFDRFTIEQLAGDLLPDATRATRIATGFHRNTQVNQEGGAKDEENRVVAVMDRVATTGSVWMGSTVACAQCHTHKFDPLTHEEYYRLYAFFDTTADGGVSAEPSLLVPPTELEPEVAAWERREAELYAALLDERARTVADGGWTVWTPDRVSGSNGPEFRPQTDGSWYVLGQNPVYSTYFLEGAPPVAGVQRLRVEALPDVRLPGGGPGRAGSGNFVLQQVRVLARVDGGAWRPIALAGAAADFEQDTSAEGGDAYPASGVLAEAGGWAVKPAFDTAHALELQFERPLPAFVEALRLELVQEFGDHHALGRFRVLLGGADAGAAANPPEAGAADGAAEAPRIRDPRRAAWTDYAAHRRARPRVPTTLVLQQAEVPRTTRLFRRGNFLDPAQELTPGFPAAMSGFQPEAVAEDRLDLAQWLIHPDNALTWRVTANRWWQQVFGTGLVATENDFGLRGAEPSHPDLLEWLAQETQRRGYSRKAMLRLLVTSATYRQSSRPRPELAAVADADALLARMPRLRLEGEVLRDAALAAAGLLDRTRGGPPVQPPQPDGVYAFTQSNRTWKADAAPARFRRSIYTRIWRSAPYPFYATFDQPAATAACTRRVRSNTPLQALAMANDPMMIEIAAGFADALLAVPDTTGGDAAAAPAGDTARLRTAFLRALARPPLPEEAALLLAHLAELRDFGDEHHAWTGVCRVLLNLDEFLTRP